MRRFEGNMKEMGSIGCFTCVLVSEIKSDGVYQCAPSLAADVSRMSRSCVRQLHARSDCTSCQTPARAGTTNWQAHETSQWRWVGLSCKPWTRRQETEQMKFCGPS